MYFANMFVIPETFQIIFSWYYGLLKLDSVLKENMSDGTVFKLKNDRNNNFGAVD